MFIGSHQLLSQLPNNITIKFHDTTIQPTKHVKNLGLHMDRYMAFDKHILEMTSKVTGTLMYVNRIKNYFDRETRSVIVQSLVLSVMNYCISIWGTTNVTQLKQVQKLQNFAAKIVDGKARKYDHVTPVLKQKN